MKRLLITGAVFCTFVLSVFSLAQPPVAGGMGYMGGYQYGSGFGNYTSSYYNRGYLGPAGCMPRQAGVRTTIIESVGPCARATRTTIIDQVAPIGPRCTCGMGCGVGIGCCRVGIGPGIGRPGMGCGVRPGFGLGCRPGYGRPPVAVPYGGMGGPGIGRPGMGGPGYGRPPVAVPYGGMGGPGIGRSGMGGPGIGRPGMGGPGVPAPKPFPVHNGPRR